MDVLDRLLGHDYWTTRQLLVLSSGLSDEQLDRPFDIGHETLRRTFVHIIGNMEVWTDFLPARPVPARSANSIPGLIARLDAIAPDFAAIARRIRDDGREDDCFTDVLDTPPRRKT